MAITRLANSTLSNGFPKYTSAKQFNLPVYSNLGFWLDASDARTIVETNGIVSQWNDKSGNGINFSQGTGGNMPTIYNDPVSKNQFIRFDGSDDFMSATSNFFANKSSFTMFWVFKWNTGSGTDYEPIMTTNTSSDNLDNGALFYVNPADRGAAYPFWQNNANNNFDAGLTYVSGTTYINNIVFANNLYSVFRNSVFDGSLAVVSSFSETNNARIHIARQHAPGRFAKFDIAEIVVYSTELTASQIDSVNRYLNAKWRAY